MLISEQSPGVVFEQTPRRSLSRSHTLSLADSAAGTCSMRSGCQGESVQSKNTTWMCVCALPVQVVLRRAKPFFKHRELRGRRRVRFESSSRVAFCCRSVPSALLSIGRDERRQRSAASASKTLFLYPHRVTGGCLFEDAAKPTDSAFALMLHANTSWIKVVMPTCQLDGMSWYVFRGCILFCVALNFYSSLRYQTRYSSFKFWRRDGFTGVSRDTDGRKTWPLVIPPSSFAQATWKRWLLQLTYNEQQGSNYGLEPQVSWMKLMTLQNLGEDHQHSSVSGSVKPVHRAAVRFCSFCGYVMWT